ncbi:MAG: hypothetical protein WBA12_01345 [Catalinimonas sp.]
MKTTYQTTFPRMAGHLLRHPRQIGDYLRYSFTRHTPLDLERPQIASTATRFLDLWLHAGMRVFEWGGGGSTLYFSKRVERVTTAGSDGGWVQQLKTQLAVRGRSNVDVRFHTYDRKDAAGFGDSAFCHAVAEGGPYDLICINGPEVAGDPARPACFERAEQHVRPGGIILVDDAWHYDHLHAQHRAHSYQVFRSVGPGRKGLARTDFYYY